MNINTFCRVVVMDVEIRYRRVLVIRPFAAEKKKTIAGVTYMGFSFQEICSFKVRFHGTLLIVVNHPLHNFSEYDEFFLRLIRMNT